VDVRVFHDVIEIDRAGKSLLVRNLLTGEERREAYDVLLLSPGAAPSGLLPGIDSPGYTPCGAFPTWIASWRRWRTTAPPRHRGGGGFIGLEMMEALHQRKLDVTLLELSDQVMAPVDKEMANLLHARIREEGSICACAPASLPSRAWRCLPRRLPPWRPPSGVDAPDPERRLSSRHRPADPRHRRQARDPARRQGGAGAGTAGRHQGGCRHAHLGSLHLRGGDAVEETDFVTGESVLIPLAGPANRQGRIAADNMLGRSETYKKTQGTAICKLFDLAVASTGLNEKRLVQLGLPFEKVYVHPGSHAGYYPGAHPVSLKLLFAPDGKIYGAQAIGKDGIDKRIDVLAVAQRAGLTVFDLQDLELTYAPPFGSAKDVINMAGFVASNHLKGDTLLCHAAECRPATPISRWWMCAMAPNSTSWGAFRGRCTSPWTSCAAVLMSCPRIKSCSSAARWDCAVTWPVAC
jgi:hypothetical protein